MTNEQDKDEQRRLERIKNRIERLKQEGQQKAQGRLEVEQGDPRPIEDDTPLPPADEEEEEDTPPPPPTEEEDDTPAPPLEDPIMRARRLAFAITAVWEGSRGYANYQNYDAGIISYGKHQVTLASGNLWRVVEDYLTHADPASEAAATLRTYATRIEARDATLREDTTLKEALLAAAAEQAMRDAQDRTIISGFWGPSQRSANRRELVMPLSHAFLFDAAIQHGPYHPYLGRAEEALGVPERQPISQTGISEEDLIIRTAEERLKAMRDFAARTRLFGVIPRAEFWVTIMQSGDWGLEGDEEGIIYVKTRPVHTWL
jgi:hypothetical protein